jgi:hypothetical protein
VDMLSELRARTATDGGPNRDAAFDAEQNACVAAGAEASLHASVRGASALFVFPSELPGWLAGERPHRAVGVVYHPGGERWGDYVFTVLGRRYDPSAGSTSPGR